jgi:hypothetical protein
VRPLRLIEKSQSTSNQVIKSIRDPCNSVSAEGQISRPQRLERKADLRTLYNGPHSAPTPQWQISAFLTCIRCSRQASLLPKSFFSASRDEQVPSNSSMREFVAGEGRMAGDNVPKEGGRIVAIIEPYLNFLQVGVHVAFVDANVCSGERAFQV